MQADAVNRPSVLVVDDNESMRLTLGALIEDENYEVGYAENGQDALRQVGEKVWDLALIDIKLPDMGGIDVTRAIKAISPRTAAYILTGFWSPQILKDAEGVGADGVFTKGDRLENLLTIIRKLLERK